MVNMISEALGAAFAPECLLLNVLGVVVGIIFGAFPGLNGVVGVALLMPITYGMDPINGIVMLAGLYMGGHLRRLHFRNPA